MIKFNHSIVAKAICNLSVGINGTCAIYIVPLTVYLHTYVLAAIVTVVRMLSALNKLS